MNFRLFAGCCALWMGSTTTASAQMDQSTELTLTWIEQQARSRNPQIIAARADREAAQEQAPQARSLDAPSLYTMFWAVPDDTPNPGSAREIWLGAKQVFPYPGKLDLRGRVAETAALIAGQRQASVEAEVVRQARRLYFDLYFDYKQIEITQSHLDLAREFEQIAEARYENGAGGQADVLKALVEIADLGNRVRVLERNLRPAKARLNALLDRDSDAELGRPAEFILAPTPPPLDTLQRRALAHRSERRAAELAVDRSQVRVELAEREYYPDFMTDFSYWNVRDRPNRWMLMVEARLPLAFWSRGRYDARTRQAQAEKKGNAADLQQLDNQILLEVEEAFAALEVSTGDVSLYEHTILPQARQAVDALRAAYQTDQTTFLNLIDSERRLLQFDLAFQRARVAREQSVADLERAVGAPLHSEEEPKR